MCGWTLQTLVIQQSTQHVTTCISQTRSHRGLSEGWPCSCASQKQVTRGHVEAWMEPFLTTQGAMCPYQDV